MAILSNETIKLARKILKERKEQINENYIDGFANLSQMVRDLPPPYSKEAAESLNFLKSRNPKPGTYNANNGSIVVIPTSGVEDTMVYVYDSQTADTRRVSYERAIQNAEDAGYKRNNGIHVPFSN